MNNLNYPLENIFRSEKVSFKNGAVTAAALCSSLLSLPVTLPKENKNDLLYSINSIADVSHSTQDYFSPHAKDYNLLLMKLDEIKSLEKNWNGYNADAIPSSVIVNAKKFISYVRDLSAFISIFPTARQSIQIELEVVDIYCEAEIFSDVFEIYAEKNNVERANKKFSSVEQASSNFKTLFNE
jgi:hypothetical protein